MRTPCFRIVLLAAMVLVTANRSSAEGLSWSVPFTASLSFSTYLGGGLDDRGFDIDLDSAGRAYVTGRTASTNFPTAVPYQGTKSGGPYDVFVSKLDPASSTLEYSTYLGGAGDDEGWGIAVDSLGSAYVTGATLSSNFPTAAAYQGTYEGGAFGDGFVARLAPSGAGLAYSTYLAGSGSDNGLGIGVDSAGNAYVTGFTDSTNFPTANAYQATLAGGYDAFVTKLDPAGSALSYSTYLGGSGGDEGLDLVVLPVDGDAYVAGITYSTNFPTESPYQATNAGSQDVFVTRVHPLGTTLVASTYLGGTSYEYGNGIAVDPANGGFAVAGQTFSTDFPVTNAYQGSKAGSDDAFVTRFDGSGTSLTFSTYLGGAGYDGASSVAIDGAGGIYVAGETASTNFPVKYATQGTNAGGASDVFTSKLSTPGALLHSTFLGGDSDDRGYGLAVDPSGSAYLTGITGSTNFPTKNPYQATLAGSYDAFVARLPARGVRFGSADFSGDHVDEIGVLRNGMWFLAYSPAYLSVNQTTAWGSPTPGLDTPEIGEFNCASGGGADGQTDLAILRKPFSTWQAALSPGWTSALSVTFGTTGHKRIPTRRLDTNGDRCSDFGVFRNGCFDVLESPFYSLPALHVCFGLGTDEPLAAELSGDDRSDLVLWRSATTHYTYRVSPAFGADFSADLGAGEVSLIGDLNGDGIADLGSYKPAFSTFRFTYSPDFAGVDLVLTHGVNGDIPIVADVNGDGISDIGVFRNATARWWFLCSPGWATTCLSQSFGTAGDVPIFGKPAGIP